MDEASKKVIVRLVELTLGRFESVTDLIRHALAAGPVGVPGWARKPEPEEEEKRLKAAKSAVSKFLGASPVRSPDWESTAWIVSVCAPAEEHEQVLAELAGMWACGARVVRPPGYIGRLVVDGETVAEALSEPEQAHDDAARAELLQRRCADLQAQLAQSRAEVATLNMRPPTYGVAPKVEVRRQQQTGGSAQVCGLSPVEDNDVAGRGQPASEKVVYLAKENLRLASGMARAQQREEVLSHHVAVLVAALNATFPLNTAPEAAGVLPVPGLSLDTELADLLDAPVREDAADIERWLSVYLRCVLLLTHAVDAGEGDIPARVPAELVPLVSMGALPARDGMAALIEAYPMLRAYGPSLLRSAQLQRKGVHGPLAMVDLRPPLTQRLQDSSTRKVRPVRPPMPSRLPVPTGLPWLEQADPAAAGTARTRDSKQITVAELLAREKVAVVASRVTGRRRRPIADELSS